MSSNEEFIQRFWNFVSSGGQALLVQTYRSEHNRLRRVLETTGKALKYEVVVWEPAHGFVGGPAIPNLVTALTTIVTAQAPALPERAIILLTFAAELFGKSEAARSLFCHGVVDKAFNRDSIRRPVVIVLGDGAAAPVDLAGHAPLYTFEPPDKSGMLEVYDRMVASWNKHLARKALEDGRSFRPPPVDPEARHQISEALLGLDDRCAEEVLAQCAKRLGGLGLAILPTVQREKDDALMASSGVLKRVDLSTLPALGDVVGMDELIPWAQRQALALTARGARHDCEAPRFVLEAGPAGTGKTTAAKLLARIFQAPCYEMNPQAAKSKFVGDSGRNIRQAFASLRAIDRAVVIVDEIEKRLAGGGKSEHVGDSGVGKEITAEMLTFISEVRCNVVILATCNTFGDMPAALLSRADEIWGVDLPDPEERWEILRVHCRLKGIHFRPFEEDTVKKQLLGLSEGFVGRDLQLALKEAKTNSLTLPEPGEDGYEEGRWTCGQPTPEMLLECLQRRGSSLDRDPQEIEVQRALAYQRTRMVSSKGARRQKAARESNRHAGGNRPVSFDLGHNN